MLDFEPLWMANLPPDQRVKALLRLRLRIAALYATEKGTLDALARVIGVTGSALALALQRGVVSAELANSVEAAAGRDVVRREDLCPVFGPPAITASDDL